MLDPKEYAAVIKGICAQMHSVPDDTLMVNVTQFCRKRDLIKLRKRFAQSADFYQHLIDLYIKYLSKDDLLAEQKMLDDRAQSMHKKPVKKSRSSILGPLSQWVDRSMHIDLDSINRDVSQDYGSAVSEFRLTLSERNDRAPLGTGIVPARLIPANITYMKIGRIILPYNQTLAALNSTQELTLTFTGLRSNGAVVANLTTNETIHFSFTYTECTFDSNLVELTPSNKYCKFDPPLTYLDNVSMRWNDPRYPVQFNIDRLPPVSFNYSSTDGRITFAVAHQLNTNDVVIVNGLTSLAAARDSVVLASINNQRGVKVTVVSSTVISIGINFTTITAADTSSLPIILFVSKCFRVPLELGYQDTDERA